MEKKGVEMKNINNSKGSAILIAMALIAMLTAIALMSVDRSNTDMQLSSNQSRDEKAFYLAEAGIERGKLEINSDNAWRGGFYKQVLDGGNYTVTVTDSSANPSLLDTIILSSEGVYIDGKAGIEAWLVPEPYYPYRFGMFAGQGLNFDRNACVDSYNSDSGTYATTLLSDYGDVGTNGDITTSSNVTIGGDANTAVGGSITLGPGSQVMGDTSTTQDSVNLDIIPQSEFDWAESNSNAPAGLSGTDFTYDASTKSLSTGKTGAVVLQSGVYYFSSISLGQESNIVLAPGANVTIYITGDIVFSQYSNVNLGGNPGAFQVFSQGSLDFNRNNTFYGTFYGPNGNIQYDQTTQVYGSLVANTIQLDQGACFHYDRSLSDLQHGYTGKMVTIAWRQIQ